MTLDAPLLEYAWIGADTLALLSHTALRGEPSAGRNDGDVTLKNYEAALSRFG